MTITLLWRLALLCRESVWEDAHFQGSSWLGLRAVPLWEPGEAGTLCSLPSEALPLPAERVGVLLSAPSPLPGRAADAKGGRNRAPW